MLKLIALVLLVVTTSVASPSIPVIAGEGPFYVETFFDEYQKPTDVTSFTYVQNGVVVTFTANAGILLRQNGMICPSNPDAGISVTLSEIMDQMTLYGTGVKGEEGLLLVHARHKTGTFLYVIDWFLYGPMVYGHWYKNNSVSGFTVTQTCLDAVRFEEHAR